MSEEKKREIKNIFIQGAISPEKIAEMIGHHRHKTGIGAHDIFMGQVRADEKDGKTVIAIEYTAYESMACEQYQQIKDEIFAKYRLSCMHTLHSLGTVSSGEICLLVFVSAPHRQDCFYACREMVERIKKELPIWGRELFEDASHAWKVNR